ncbi:hypothetical protein ZHAS_00011731 [Anopheles sinensis]|uniref:Uncharacterized protein n=1 Tax=Anopheles sinensis TaxID=74873 RepID=A0A084W114_ANOSI|nr:hypothetical protein ZHAS_00011731 [Anopheles sinensis]
MPGRFDSRPEKVIGQHADSFAACLTRLCSPRERPANSQTPKITDKPHRESAFAALSALGAMT